MYALATLMSSDDLKFQEDELDDINWDDTDLQIVEASASSHNTKLYLNQGNSLLKYLIIDLSV